MDEQGFCRQLAFVTVMALLVAACDPLGAPRALNTQPTIQVGQANVRSTARQPAYPGPTQAPPAPSPVPPSPAPPSPTPPQPLAITIDSPTPGTLVGSPVVITGRTDRLPQNSALNYRFVDGAGQPLGTGTIPVSGAPGQPGSFNASLTFNLPRDGGPVRIELTEPGNPAGAQPAFNALDMVVDAQYQAIFIDTPSGGTVVGSPVVLTGRTARSPADGNLGYLVFNSAGQQIGGDAFPVSGAPGAQRSFNAELYFDLPIDGDTIRVELYDRNPATGNTEAAKDISLVVLPIPQQISFETPPAMTLVGSPVVITGRTTRYPAGGDLNYRITNDAGKELGAGTFQVAGAAGQPTTFNPSLTFQIPRDGGTVHLEVYDQDAPNGATANSILDMDVLAQYQAIVIDTPAPGTQVGSPVVITGRTNLYPNGGQLQYRLVDAGGKEIGAGAFSVDGAPGQRGSFVASLTFAEPPNGGNIRIELVDRAANGATVAAAALDMAVAPPPPQQILIDTPAPGTQVGSPVVITGRTARYPASGKLNYRVIDASGAVIGSGQLGVASDSMGSRGGGFNASLTFTEPRGGGNVTVEIYAPSPVSSAIVSASIGLYVAPRP